MLSTFASHLPHNLCPAQSSSSNTTTPRYVRSRDHMTTAAEVEDDEVCIVMLQQCLLTYYNLSNILMFVISVT